MCLSLELKHYWDPRLCFNCNNEIHNLTCVSLASKINLWYKTIATLYYMNNLDYVVNFYCCELGNDLKFYFSILLCIFVSFAVRIKTSKRYVESMYNTIVISFFENLSFDGCNYCMF